jgi:two-component sensor histidine kinase
LVTNALKYAYPGGEGEIRVGLRQQGDTMHLTVEDDGIGYPEGATPKGSGLGSVIVSAMARQVKATVEVDSGPCGTRVLLCMPV